MITVDSGIIVIMRDGSIVNFPDGNDEEYLDWCKTDDSRQAVLYMAGKDVVAEHICKGNDADYFIDEARLHFEFDVDDLLGKMRDFYEELEDEQRGEIGMQVITRLFDTDPMDYLKVLGEHRNEDQKRIDEFGGDDV